MKESLACASGRLKVFPGKRWEIGEYFAGGVSHRKAGKNSPQSHAPATENGFSSADFRVANNSLLQFGNAIFGVTHDRFTQLRSIITPEKFFWLFDAPMPSLAPI